MCCTQIPSLWPPATSHSLLLFLTGRGTFSQMSQASATHPTSPDPLGLNKSKSPAEPYNMFILTRTYVLKLYFILQSCELVTFRLSAVTVFQNTPVMYLFGFICGKGSVWLLTHLRHLTAMYCCKPVHDLSRTFMCVRVCVCACVF